MAKTKTTKPTKPPKATKPHKATKPKAEAPKAETPKAETPKAEAPKAETPKAETPKAEAPKTLLEDAFLRLVEAKETVINVWSKFKNDKLFLEACGLEIQARETVRRHFTINYEEAKS